MRILGVAVAVVLAWSGLGCGGGSSSPTPQRFSITGAVTGPAAAGVAIALSGAASAGTTTDSAGHYAFQGLLPGSYVVTPSWAPFVYAPASLPVNVVDRSVTVGPFATTTCDATAPFVSIRPLPGIGLSGLDYTGAALTADERTVVFISNQAPYGLWMATRARPSEPFSTPRSLGLLGAPSPIYEAAISPDGLALYLHAQPTTAGLYFATRPSLSADFGTMNPLPGIGTPGASEDSPFVTATALYFGRAADGFSDFQIWRAPRTGPGPADFGAAAPVTELLSPGAYDESAVLDVDERTIYFASWRGGGKGLNDIWVAYRSSPTGTFSAPVPVAELNTSTRDLPDWMSVDSCRLYFESNRDEPVAGLGPRRLYVADRRP